jgi:uncharacterized protein YndB with AHSA1/START domain
MPHPPEKMWRALTQGALIEEWLMPNDFQPVVGHRFNFRSTPMPHWNGVVDCEVLVVEPNQRLSYRWKRFGRRGRDGDQDDRHLDAGANGGTQVRMEQSGFRLEDARNYQGANYGWQKYVAGLERVAAGLK